VLAIQSARLNTDHLKPARYYAGITVQAAKIKIIKEKDIRTTIPFGKKSEQP